MGSGRPPAPVLLAVLAVVALALAHRDEIRERAVEAMGRGMPAREAALARGFVLGEDEAIDPPTVEGFRRAGLGHLLAVSGQNVALLALLAMPLLAALGMPLRARLLWVLGAIAVYVPLAGAGPSIVRAGVMGGLSVLAALAGRRAPRLYALAIAAIVTLAIEPRIGADVGWQLSFAAVLGILAWAAPLRAVLAARIGARGPAGMLADGAAITVAATLATAPLVAFHFGTLSTTSLLANLLALPAVAPAMWLGMLAGVAGQVPGLPLAPLNALNALLLAYIAQVAAWCGGPGWAQLEVRPGGVALAASYAFLATASIAVPTAARRCRLARLRGAPGRGASAGAAPTPGCNAFYRRWPFKTLHLGGGVGTAAGLAVAGLALLLLLGASSGGPRAAAPVAGLRVSFLDVGQGDAILLQPAGAPAVLVDGGPPGGGLAGRLASAGVERLGLAVVTHDQADHAGGIAELLGSFPIARLGYARLGRELRAEAAAHGAGPIRIAAGQAVRSGALRLEALWPPPELLDSPLAGSDPNSQALVLLARWRGFTMLLAADAEAEAVPLDPGPVDVLKVAHHGSEDAGLGALLERTRPRLAVISVGADNPHGHPSRATLQDLAGHGVPLLRTDREGTIVVDVPSEGRGAPRMGGYSERAKRASPGEGRSSLP